MSFQCTIKVGKRGQACFSECGTYRYMLMRKWGLLLKGLVNFVMLNPSTATEDEDDPTIRRCIGYAKQWGFDGIIITNIFALRSTMPNLLYGHEDPIGPDNDAHLAHWPTACKLVVCAWGKHGDLHARGNHVRQRILLITHRVALKILSDKENPSHPLYLPKDLEPVEF